MEFTAKKSGTSSTTGANWALIQDEQEGIVVRAFITTTKLIKEGDKFNIPEKLVALIPWSL